MSFQLQKVIILGISLVMTNSCSSQSSRFLYKGRVEKKSADEVVLIGSASSVSFAFKGNSCDVYLQSVDSWKHHNYVSLELDGNYIGRLKVEKGDLKKYAIPISTPKEEHTLTLYKSTEALNGGILFQSTTAELIGLKSSEPKKKIEFIGNSITCGMGNDLSIPCHTNEWFDQHNAYWAYGPILSRKLNADFLLSSVSGIGMYRNWNDENIEEAIMPEVYEKLYLTKSSTTPFGTEFQPDLVSVCLGTNDLSDGNGIKKRLPFNEDKYVTNYINFIKTIYKRYPNTKIVLLNSPMISGEKNTVLIRCLKRVIDAFKETKTIYLFEFPAMEPKGCDYHPDIEDHKVMAELLEKTFSKLLHE
jgi:lysophospholipase L1-like esterase